MVPDIIAPGLDVLFVGYNPGVASDSQSHHFAGPGNLFWALLVDSQFTPYRLRPENDRDLLLFRLGITNIVDRMTPSSTDLSLQEMSQGAQGLAEKIRQFQPKIVCFLGKDIFRAFMGYKRSMPVSWGYVMADNRDGPGFFVAPNPSRRSTIPYGLRLYYFRSLANIVRYGVHPHIMP
ncbi:G/U mismatch-specific uracil-DNA glycosylase [Sulfobacillus thermosulfidooxidans DSM 9293]|uniref:G/U mismatch-specific uracil-DNA glycosylase n=1 Tax=Sulfobacillus thermosulfidooxidans (strain DSM 9293 / VKM B-1269 / AT-1) TaxID=929705 RepID=A0A1W1WDK0_SULTA|nr:mismatch-specific DNA-glycosylase [Sulfobacillus thermosulfidooxidans]SMC04249.1 G/U mismatch-specific uracil-DNA glycosylase [Sulfobacillus thermosulfidooxidans DSM 9293]